MALQIAPLIVLERRILILLYLFMAGTILFHLLPLVSQSRDYFNWLLSGALLAMIVGLVRRSMPAIVLDMIGFFIISVTRFPCYGGKPIYNINQKTGYNYLIYVDKDKLRIINNFGSSLQACPALQPRPC